MRFLCIVFSFLSTLYATAQIDTEFWFAAPEITDLHGDEPIYLNITTYEEETTVTISIPALNSFESISVTIPANSFESIDISDYKTSLECFPHDSILNNGLHINATHFISAQYLVEGSYGYNKDLFSLKGKNALGTKFIAPFQNLYNNQLYTYEGSTTLLEAYSSIDIIATEDSTIVEITPSQDALHHLKGKTFTIMLHKGQCYSLRAIDEKAENRLSGTLIQSNKNIAVTVKDDSVFKGDNWDMIGDQIIPISNYGKAYVAFKGYACLQAADKSTIIHIDNDSISLAAYENQCIPITDTSTYIHSEDEFGLFQIAEITTPSGDSGEVAGAVLSPFGCHDASESRFTRNTDINFDLYLLTDETGINNFKINGATWDIKDQFHKVENSPELYLAIIKDSGNIYFTLEESYTLSNSTSNFQLNIKSGDITSGCSFGGYSSYGIPRGTQSLTTCNDISQTRLFAGANYNSYLWSNGSTKNFIDVDSSGTWWVEFSNNNCTFTDTIKVQYVPSVNLFTTNDTSFCEEGSIKLTFDSTWIVFYKNEILDSNTITLYSPGNYPFKAINTFECKDIDTLNIQKFPNPYINLGNDTTTCPNTTLTLGTPKTGINYLWNTGDTSSTIKVNTQGEYILNSWNSCGNYLDSISITHWSINIPNIITPNNDGKNDFFVIETDQPGQFELEIYNRWGSKVYYNDNYQNEFNGNKLTAGTYYYHTQAKNHQCTVNNGWLYIQP